MDKIKFKKLTNYTSKHEILTTNKMKHNKNSKTKNTTRNESGSSTENTTDVRESSHISKGTRITCNTSKPPINNKKIRTPEIMFYADTSV
jgi:hypothetical protein